MCRPVQLNSLLIRDKQSWSSCSMKFSRPSRKWLKRECALDCSGNAAWIRSKNIGAAGEDLSTTSSTKHCRINGTSARIAGKSITSWLSLLRNAWNFSIWASQKNTPSNFMTPGLLEGFGAVPVSLRYPREMQGFGDLRNSHLLAPTRCPGCSAKVHSLSAWASCGASKVVFPWLQSSKWYWIV